MTKEETRYYAKYVAATGEFHAMSVRWLDKPMRTSFATGFAPSGWYDENGYIYHGKTYASPSGAIKAARSTRRGGK